MKKHTAKLWLKVLKYMEKNLFNTGKFKYKRINGGRLPNRRGSWQLQLRKHCVTV
jgi:hypothetical protein